MKESDWTREICNELVRFGCTVDSIVGGNPMQKKGLPDRTVYRERVWQIEFKGERTKLTPLQIAVHEQRNRYGKNVFVARYPGILTMHTPGGVVDIGRFTSGQSLLNLLLVTTGIVK